MLSVDIFAIAGITARTFGLLISLPTGDALQTLPRLFIAVCFAAALAPSLAIPDTFSWYRLIPEFLIGLLIAAPIRFLAEAGEMFGEVIDTARGQTIGSVMDPLNGQQVSDMATLTKLAVTVLAIQLGGFDLCVAALRQSYDFFPLGGLQVGDQFLMAILHSGIGIVSAALAFSSVWLLAYLITDLSAALFTKVCQGLCFSTTANMVKMILTFVLLINLLMQPKDLVNLIKRELNPALYLSVSENPSDRKGGGPHER
jgi:flagellar biosynthesis protein FliR